MNHPGADTRIGWYGLATIWFGGVISVPALLVGATLIAGLGFGPALGWSALGFLVVDRLPVLKAGRVQSVVEFAQHDFVAE